MGKRSLPHKSTSVLQNTACSAWHARDAIPHAWHGLLSSWEITERQSSVTEWGETLTGQNANPAVCPSHSMSHRYPAKPCCLSSQSCHCNGGREGNGERIFLSWLSWSGEFGEMSICEPGFSLRISFDTKDYHPTKSMCIFRINSSGLAMLNHIPSLHTCTASSEYPNLCCPSCH